LPLSVHILRRVAELIAGHAGLRPPEWVLKARLESRIAALGLEQADRYAALIESPDGARELELLVEALRVGETRFFRHRAHVQAVQGAVVPALAAARASGPVRAWSAGCATGEEAYTLAILLSRGLPSPIYQVSVHATDISKEALEIARAGEYPAAALDHVPEDLRRRAFETIDDGRVRVAAAYRRLVQFESHNLTEPAYPQRLDLIWCRNVLIYFAPDARRQVVLRLIDSLAPGGFLFVGYAESLRDFEALQTVRTPDAVLYRKPLPGERPRRASAPMPVPPLVRTPMATPLPAPPARARRETPGFGGVELEEAVLELRGRYDDGDRLGRELTAVLSGSYKKVIIDLDGADYLDDAAGAVLRRACSAARAAGVEVVLVAERQSTRRWLARSGAGEDKK
jgi:chemotaxis methyl-accepting protein methylase/anti-anti-sigma regulatory factor